MMSTVLAFYDVNKLTTVSADSCSYGLRDMLLQWHGDEWRRIVYFSRRLCEEETWHAQIEKGVPGECLGFQEV